MTTYARSVQKNASIFVSKLNTATGNIEKKHRAIFAYTPDMEPGMLDFHLPVTAMKIQAELAALLTRAIEAGLVISVKNVPLKDLAMGNHYMEAEVYPCREYVSMNYEEIKKRKEADAARSTQALHPLSP